MSTSVDNKKYAHLGVVRITFADDSYVEKTINSLGVTVFDSDPTRQAVSITVLGQTFTSVDTPAPLTYPDMSVGTISGQEMSSLLATFDIPWYMDATV